MMDRNTLIGLLLIGAILIGFSIYNSPTQEQIAQQRKIQDSLRAMEQIKEKEVVQNAVENAVRQSIAENAENAGDESVSDSLLNMEKMNRYGVFYPAAEGLDTVHVLENEDLRLYISNKGGRIVKAELKEYRRYDSLPLVLFNADSSAFGIGLIANNRVVSTDSLYFRNINQSFTLAKQDDARSFTMRMELGKGKHLDYVYTLPGKGFMVDVSVKMTGMNDIIPPNINSLTLNWWQTNPRQEKNIEAEANASTIYYQFTDEEMDYLSETSDEKENIPNNLKWVAFKQQYFTSVLVAKNVLEKPTELETRKVIGSDQYTKHMRAELTLPFTHKASEQVDFSLYLGPNHFQTLKAYGLGMEKQIPLGWGIMGWINRFCVIPIFNFFEGFNLNYGIIILILTIVIKVVLFPLTYRAYLSSAKMKILKPEMDEINVKFANDDPMKKQQAIMSLYKRAGVNPLGGCLPMLLQLPILFAMFRFFPASIELRQQGFLWADDLSTYDSIYDLPFNIPFYGDHISLFTLLMTVSTILYTRMNSSQFAGNAQMAQMKWIMYLMPVVFLGVFNNYSSGLSYYYFLANMITFSQQYLIRKFVDEDAIHRKIQENKKRPASQTKSKFQQRIEDLAKKQQELQRQQQAKKGKKK
jgi:YidC/Oxa1 family membrane protein insertase